MVYYICKFYKKYALERRAIPLVFSDLFFIYAFLAANLLCCAFSRNLRVQNAVLLAFSLAFYAWGEPVYLLLLIGVALVDFLCARAVWLGRHKRPRRFPLILACVLTLGALAVFKYTGFFARTAQSLTGWPAVIPQIALPIGISFYTFQALSYVVDVYRGEVEPERSFARFLMYVSLFHQCVAGPIVRYADVAQEIVSRRVERSDLSDGITRFTVGLGKKVLLANTCGLIADTALMTESAASDVTKLNDNLAALSARPVLLLWLGVIAYMLQIYLDFSAYSDMAIGMGRMVGFHYKENFRYPYMARSVRDFWHRWHISLSGFFRDYVYIPLGGSRRGMGRTLLNMLIVWALTGLWHGASWNFVLWGLWFFLLLAIERLFLGKWLERHPAVGHIGTLFAVLFSWVLFRFRELPLCLAVLRGMFGLNGNPFSSFETGSLWLNYLFFLPVAILACTPLLHNLHTALARRARTDGGGVTALLAVTETLAPPALLLLSTAALVGNSYNPFLYFQF